MLRALRSIAVLCAALTLAGSGEARATSPSGTRAQEITAAVLQARTFQLRRPATHVAVHWRGEPRARVQIAFSADGARFGARTQVSLDEVGMQRPTNETYGSMMLASDATAVRVWTDRPLRPVSVLALTDRGARGFGPMGGVSSAAVTQPAVISRAGWGADESLRFGPNGDEIWPPTFWPLQKLIVHHSATQNNDPDPPATIRSIYYYHAVTQGWGDIGYNFLVDEDGNVYEGRHSRTYEPGESPTGEDVSGNGVTGAHAVGYNSGTVGIALLGTLTNRDATSSARDALVGLLAWKAARHEIDPQGSDEYVNPVSGTTASFSNIAGHRDVAETECPGSSFYATLPSLRADVAEQITQGSEYARPQGASPVRVSLVPAFEECTSANTSHGSPLASPACAPPRPRSGHLTVGTPEANGRASRSTGFLRLAVLPGNPETTTDEADVRIGTAVSDVRHASDLSPYLGTLRAVVLLRATDHLNGDSLTQPATATDTPLSFTIPCAPGAEGSGATCSLGTTMDAVAPGSVPEGKRSVWQLGEIDLYDGGPDGDADTADNAVFARQGIFVP